MQVDDSRVLFELHSMDYVKSPVSEEEEVQLSHEELSQRIINTVGKVELKSNDYDDIFARLQYKVLLLLLFILFVGSTARESSDAVLNSCSQRQGSIYSRLSEI